MKISIEFRGKGLACRSREEFGEPSNVEGYNGPWRRYENEIRVSKPTEEEMAIIEAQKRSVNLAEKQLKRNQST